MSAQAGANQVIALEASSMAEKIEIVGIVIRFRFFSSKKTHTQPNDWQTVVSIDGESCQ